ncbi:hypothetical protein RFS42_002408 [Vibrio vulnificus]|nr:hypothetical protein [Vibrio vulnificus]ELA4930667.1 hypothetical protein [Vibrio vulnificus]ELV8613860.1 hypothetical protein [Vibrio vulnificus]
MNKWVQTFLKKGLITSMSGFKMKQDLASKTRQLDFGLSVAQDQEW